jgi:hypothetical protein
LIIKYWLIKYGRDILYIASLLVIPFKIELCNYLMNDTDNEDENISCGEEHTEVESSPAHLLKLSFKPLKSGKT